MAEETGKEATAEVATEEVAMAPGVVAMAPGVEGATEEGAGIRAAATVEMATAPVSTKEDGEEVEVTLAPAMGTATGVGPCVEAPEATTSEALDHTAMGAQAVATGDK